MKIHFVILALLFLQFAGCGKIIEKFKSKDSSKNEQTDVDKKQRELELKEKELELEKQKLEFEKQKQGSQETAERETSGNNQNEKSGKEQSLKKIDLTDFATMWFGTIRDGTDWEVSITDFDGRNFKGRNTIYWKTTPNGFSTNFKGSVDDQTGTVVMYEDKNAKGSGKFSGTVNKSGTRMSGSWSRYSDGVTFNWSLDRMEANKY